MKILITGTQGLARSLASCYHSHDVDCVSRKTGHDIKDIANWGQRFLNHDIVFNCAYDQHGQLSVLEYFFQNWKDDQDKTIVTIGSRIINYPRIERSDDYFPYKINKSTLQNAHDQMLITAACRMLIVNPGPIDTKMIQHLSCEKISPETLAGKISRFVEDPTIKRVDLWV